MFDHILSILFPERCRGCQKSGTALCSACLATIPQSPLILEDIPSMAFFDYGNKIVQKAIWELKYHHKSAAAKILAQHGAPEVIEFLSSLLQSTTPTKIVLVPIPQHYTKTFQRGFNQSALIAKWLSRYIPSTEVRPMIKKHRSTIPQAKAMSKAERQKNLKGSMRATQKLDRKTLYILVDDVITTSSTINEASRALCAAGARNICAVAIAHGHANRFN